MLSKQTFFPCFWTTLIYFRLWLHKLFPRRLLLPFLQINASIEWKEAHCSSFLDRETVNIVQGKDARLVRRSYFREKLLTDCTLFFKNYTNCFLFHPGCPVLVSPTSHSGCVHRSRELPSPLSSARWKTHSHRAKPAPNKKVVEEKEKEEKLSEKRKDMWCRVLVQRYVRRIRDHPCDRR